MTGFRVAGSHNIINKQFGGIAGLQKQLAAMASGSEAARMRGSMGNYLYSFIHSYNSVKDALPDHATNIVNDRLIGLSG